MGSLIFNNVVSSIPTSIMGTDIFLQVQHYPDNDVDDSGKQDNESRGNDVCEDDDCTDCDNAKW